MASAYRHYLTPDDLAMLSRALTRVQVALRLDKASDESEALASSMIVEFQKLRVTEDEIVSTFLDIARHHGKRRA